MATVIAFFFFSLSIREKPFKESSMNWIKLFSEFQIFGVLQMCVVLQGEAVGFETEVITVEVYGAIQTVLTLAIVPVVLYIVVDSFRGIKANAKDLKAKKQDPQDDDNPVFEMENATSSQSDGDET